MRYRTLLVTMACTLAASADAMRRPRVDGSVVGIATGQSVQQPNHQQHSPHSTTYPYHHKVVGPLGGQEPWPRSRSRRRRSLTTGCLSSESGEESLVRYCSVSKVVSSPGGGRSIPVTLLRGALLRIASDLSGGTAFESVKCRVAATTESASEALRGIVQSGGGIHALWTGTSSRTVEGALVGSLFMLSSTVIKAQIKALGGGPTVAALGGGLVGGVAQALVMTPCGLIFTSLNVNRGKPGYENDNAWTVSQRILRERQFMGLFSGFQPMALRQATNWASRAGLTELARSVGGLQRFGIMGEIGSGILGGLGSCWNTPVETIRVRTQRDLCTGVVPMRTMRGYWNEILEHEGYPGLFRGITPRALQAIWQTCFMVVVPNILGI